MVVDSCESKPCKVQENVKGRDVFWVKEKPYSVLDTFGGEPMGKQFIGRTIYQAFLSALSYHRRHEPVSGRIVKAYTIHGTYYSQPLSIDLDTQDDGSPVTGQEFVAAQSYLASMATRAAIFIEADNPAIGMMAFVDVGMAGVDVQDDGQGGRSCQ